MPAFYSSNDEDNTSLRSIIGSFEIQVLPFDIAQITNTPNGHSMQKWWEELRPSEEDVASILTWKRSVHVRDIHTYHLLTSVNAVYLVVQHTVLPRSGNIDVMTEVDQMVVFCLMTKRRINLVKLILDFILSAAYAERRRHATLPYGMFLTRVFRRA